LVFRFIEMLLSQPCSFPPVELVPAYDATTRMRGP